MVMETPVDGRRTHGENMSVARGWIPRFFG